MTRTRLDRLELRGHMVRRLPTKSDLATRTPIALTFRDKNILDALYKHGFLTTDLVELAFFPPGGSRRSYSARAYARLRQLWLWGYVDRVEQPVARTIGGRRPFLYALGPRGVPIVASRLSAGAAPVQRRRLDRLDDMFIEHDLMAAPFWANLRAALRSRPIAKWSWYGERWLRSKHLRTKDPDTRFGLSFLLDGLFQLRAKDGGIQTSVLEIDMGTLTSSRFRRKVRAFEAFRNSGQLDGLFGDGDFDVLVLTHSPARMNQLIAAAAKEIPENRKDWYLFATLDVLDPSRFLDKAWADVSGDYSHVFSGRWFLEPRSAA